MNTRIYILFIIWLLLFGSCNNKNKNSQDNIKTKITFERMDSLEPLYNKAKKYSKRFIVHGFTKSKKNYAIIDSFVCENIDSDYANHIGYFISFYRYSQKTNNDYFKKVPRDFYRYSMSHDIICYYTWRNGTFFPKEVFPDFNEYKSFDVDTLVCPDTTYIWPY